MAHARMQTLQRAVVAGMVIATAMIAGTFSIPVHAAEFNGALAPSPTPETSHSSDAGMPCPLIIIAGLLVTSIASFFQNGFKKLY